jgi:hypothetical protein
MRTWLTILFVAIWFTGKAQEYFQQQVDYEISVKLDDKSHVLRGFEKFTYTNHSPQKLDTLWLHLWPNAYSTKTTALAKQLLSSGEYDFHYATLEEMGYIDSLQFHINDTLVSHQFHKEHVDIAWILIPGGLVPGNSIVVTTPFRVKLPDAKFSRLGHVEQSYMITQWYPKPAVYDHEGWHAMPYLNQGEFYSEFGSFKVKVTLPKNYVVGATGDLQEDDEKIWLQKRVAYTDSVLKHVPVKEIKVTRMGIDFPPTAGEWKTLTYNTSNVHDFAWFADKRWFVLKGEVALPSSGRKVDTWAMFTGYEASLWRRASEYLRDATYYYSLWNGDYPYNHVTAVDGTIAAGGGMEYPNITVIGSSNSAFGLETVIMHEVGHNWFYGILGSNERRHAWMDEGLNSLNESRYIATKYPKKLLTDELGGFSRRFQERFRLDIYKQLAQYQMFYLINAVRNMDQPMDLPSEQFTSMNYGGIVYSKTAVMFNYLRNYLGDEVFDHAMHTYFERWKFKHPQPEDLQKVFQEITGKDMGWFFEDIVKTTGTLDIKLVKSKKPADDVIWRDAFLKVKQKGTINGPFSISAIKEDTVAVTVWYDSVPEGGMVQFPDRDVQAWRIDPYMVIPEVNRKNNILKNKGLFKKTEPWHLQFLTGLEDPERTTLYYIPIIAGNKWDGLMLGAGLHNYQLPERKIQWSLMPLFGLRSKSLVGMGNIQFRLPTTHNKVFQQVYLILATKSFSTADSSITDMATPSWFNKWSLRIDAMLRKKVLSSPSTNRLSFEAMSINETLKKWNNYGYINELSERVYYDVFHELVIKKPFLLFKLETGLRGGFNRKDNGEELFTVQTDVKLAWRYNKRGDKLTVRGFAGRHFINTTRSGRYNWQADGPGSFFNQATSDFRYEHFYLGRNALRNDFLGQQVVQTQGGLIAPTSYSSSDWLVALNVKFRLPLPVGISLFSNAAWIPVTIFSQNQIIQSADMVADAGLSFSIIKEVLELHIPLWASDNIRNEWSINSIMFWQRIRFTMNLNYANPAKLIDKLI